MSLFMWFFASQDIIWFFLMLFGAFREKKKTSIYLPQVAITKRNWSEKHFFFLSKGFLIFVLHCVRNSQVSFKTWGFKTWMYLECGSFFFFSMSIDAFICLFCLSICRLESDSKGRWTRFSHLQTMETPQRRAHRLIQVVSVIHG